MNEVEARIVVQKMQEYIEAHIDEKITLKQLARAVGYSPSYVAKIFKEVTGRSPFDYIRTLRLSNAAMVLRDNDKRIIDVAMEFVFDSHEGFTRAFSREFGISPIKYSHRTPPIKLFRPYKVFEAYQARRKGEESMSQTHQTKSIFVQIVERPVRKVLLKRGKEATDYFTYYEEGGGDVWPVLTSVKEAMYEPIGMWLPKHLIKEGTSEYVQGVEVPVDYSNDIPEGYELIELPPCKMMVFQGEPYEEEDMMSEIGEVMNHIKKFDPSIYGYEWAPDEAPRFQLEPWGYRGYIEAHPVRTINPN